MGRRQTSSLRKRAELDLEDQIEAHLLEQVRKAQGRNPFKGPTVGLEQEFFVFKSNGTTPADLADTQLFLRTLSTHKGWTTIALKDRPGTSVLTRVSYEHDHGRYTAIKYEFPPHLLEVAFTYYDDLKELNHEVESRWRDLQETAETCQLKLALKPFIDPPILNLEDQISVDPKLPALAESRRVYFKRRGEQIDSSIVDFPSFVAATQTQVGIPFAWGKEKFMHRLYALELSMLPLLNESPDILGRRQSYYDGVFRGMNLLGIPDLRKWTLRAWTKTLCDSPLISTLKSGNDTLRSLWSSGVLKDFGALLSRTRDLQIVRPKAIGTIEFRGDASVSNSADMTRVAALRFAGALLAADVNISIPNEDMSFSQIRGEWQKRIGARTWNESQHKEANQVYEAMLKILKSRGRSEECFLVFKKEC